VEEQFSASAWSALNSAPSQKPSAQVGQQTTSVQCLPSSAAETFHQLSVWSIHTEASVPNHPTLKRCPAHGHVGRSLRRPLL
jgi:hypothetical protein